MDLSPSGLGSPSRLRLLLEHFSRIEDVCASHRVAFPMAELLLLAACGTIADCDDYDAIAVWGDAHLDFLRRFLPYHHGVPSGRWLTIMMNRINPALFSACFTSWVRACWPDRPDLVAIDGKTSRRSHDRSHDKAPLHLVSAFATTSGLVLGQEAVAGRSNELTAIPALLERLAADGGLNGAVVTIDAIACNGAVAKAVREAGAHYLLAVKANQPTLRDEIERFFRDAEPSLLSQAVDVDKGHGRIETRTVTIAREVDWLGGDRRFPGELRLPDVAAIVRVESKAELKDRCRFETRYYVASASLSAEAAAAAIRSHWGIEKPTALGARRRLQRRPVPAAQGPWRSQHGGRTPLRRQSGPNRARTQAPPAPNRATPPPQTQRRPQKNKPQTSSKNRRMGHPIPPRRPRS